MLPMYLWVSEEDNALCFPGEFTFGLKTELEEHKNRSDCSSCLKKALELHTLSLALVIDVDIRVKNDQGPLHSCRELRRLRLSSLLNIIQFISLINKEYYSLSGCIK